MKKTTMFLFSILVIFMTLKGSNNGACAACKYQRRRCAIDCPLAPYFPAEQPKLFQNVHRLFGVRSIIKILEKLDDTQKPEAMKSIIFESYIRERSPVQGCLGIIQNLQYLLLVAEEELKYINLQLQRYRPQQHQRKNHDNHTSQLDLGLTVNNNLAFSFLPSPSSYVLGSCSEVHNDCNMDTNNIIINNNHDTDWRYSSYNGFDDDNEDIKTIPSLQQHQKRREDEDDKDDIHFFNNSFDEDSKDGYVSNYNS